MSKYIANNIFNDKISVYVTECLSTNDILTNLLKRIKINEGTSVRTDFQLKGKGQRENKWLSEKNSNILFSFLLSPKIKVENQFYLHIVISIAIVKCLKKIGVNCKIKWPNDIYIGEKKIAGILIESFIYQRRVQNSVVGIGLNLNQKRFEGLNATSVYIETLEEFDKIKVIETLKGFISNEYNNIHKIFDKKIIEYRKLLYGLYEMKRFKIGSEIVKAKIIDISVNGDLVLNINNKQKSFSHGSLSLLTD